MATSRKTLQLDLLQLNALNFKTSSNTNIPSTFVLSANGDGTTSFNSISSLTTLGYNTISVPGQSNLYSASTSGLLHFSSLTSDIFISTSQSNSFIMFGLPNIVSTINSTILITQTSTLNSVLPSTCIGLENEILRDILPPYVGNTMASTMFNILTYPNIYSSINYTGSSGVSVLSTLSNLSQSGTAAFSSFQYNFTSFSQYINPNGSSRVFLEINPSFTFSQVSAPSSISSTVLFPEGNPSIKNLLSISSHLIYDNGLIVPVVTSGIQQYIPVTSFQPYGYSTNTKVLSNTFIQPMRMEINSSLLYPTSPNFSLQHYLSDAVAYKTTDIVRSGLEKSTIQINTMIGDKNSVFIRITNSGNQF